MLGLEKKGEVLCRVCGDKVRYLRFFVPGYNLSLIVKITLQLLMIKWCSNYHLMCSESDPDRRVESITESHRVMAVVDSSNAAFVASPQCEPLSFKIQALISTFSMSAMLTNIWSFLGTLTMCARKREGLSIKSFYMWQHRFEQSEGWWNTWSLSSGVLWMLPGETNAKVVGEIPSCFVFVSFFLLSYARQPGDEKKDG